MEKEKRLIDANEYKMALEKMREDACATHDWGYEAVLDDCIWELDAQTTVDAVEVVHGRWVMGFSVRCSVCNGYAPTDEDHDPWITPYCHNCGAKMDGGSHEVD